MANYWICKIFRCRFNNITYQNELFCQLEIPIPRNCRSDCHLNERKVNHYETIHQFTQTLTIAYKCIMLVWIFFNCNTFFRVQKIKARGWRGNNSLSLAHKLESLDSGCRWSFIVLHQFPFFNFLCFRDGC